MLTQNYRAAASSPCVVFFDELDALAPRRSSDESNEASKRVVNQLLTEMDGLDRRNEIFVIAATNRPGMFLYLFCLIFLFQNRF